ncbi:MAG: response regulator, partial [Methylococcaceae bacterium]|nr:response regulator [Methylococcaceae bacterium]
IAMRADEKNIELICSIESELPEFVIGDSIRLQQVIINLVGNAVKFTEQGEILIKVEAFKSQQQTQKKNALLVHFSVHDSGIGIDKKKQEKIFEAFGQSDASMTRHYGGTGLGLTISYHLVKLMGGEMWLESEVGKGSIFHFTIELVAQQKIIKTASKSIDSIKDAKVLIVDDNATNRLVLNEVLLNWGMKPFAVENAEAALDILRQVEGSDNAFQIIMTDYQMPGLTGLELAQKVRDNAYWEKTPIIMLSSVSSIANIENIETSELVDVFLEKPVQQSRLLEKIESICNPSKNIPPKDKQEESYSVNPDLRILLAEDNLTNQEVARGLLKKQGITQLTIVDNGKKAVDAYQQQSFDVILMDVRMPEMDGLQATTAIREIEKNNQSKPIVIVALTAQAMKEDIEECLSTGMDYYASKPIKPIELFNILATIAPVTSGNNLQLTEQRINAQEDNDIFDLEDALIPVAGDLDILHRVVEIFLNTNEGLLENLRKAVNLDDANAIRNTAHTIKGAANNFGAKKVVEVAFKLEQMGRSENTQDCEVILKQLEIENRRLVMALQNFQNEGLL